MLKILQAVDKKSFKARQEAIFKEWIKSLLPEAGPDGKLLMRSRKKEILDYCEGHKKEFFSVRKSLHVEDANSGERISGLTTLRLHRFLAPVKKVGCFVWQPTHPPLPNFQPA